MLFDKKLYSAPFVGFSALTLLTLALGLSGCTQPTPTPSPTPTPVPVLAPVRSNSMAGINGVAGAPSQLRNLAAQTSAQWDRIPFRWYEVVEQGAQYYDATLAAETMPQVLGILTDRDPGVAGVDMDCVTAVIRSVSNNEPLPDKSGYVRYYDNRYNCVRYIGYPYDYSNKTVIMDEAAGYQPPIKNGTVNRDNKWAMFVYETVSRFHRDGTTGPPHIVDAWQIFNEYEAGFSANWCPYQENDPLFSSVCTVNQTLTGDWLASHGFGSAGVEYLPPPRVYVQMVVDAARVIHLVDPDAVVVLGGQWEETLNTDNVLQRDDNWYTWVLRHLSEHPERGQIGGLGLHSYSDPHRSRDFMAIVNNDPRTLWPNLKDKPFWLTETGVQDEASAGGFGSTACQNWPCATTEGMASYVIQNYAWALRGFHETSGPGRIFHFNLQDLSDRYFGLFDHSGNPKPAYYAYALVTGQLSGAEYDSTDEKPDRTQMTFRRDDGAWVTVAWATEGSPTTAVVPI